MSDSEDVLATAANWRAAGEQVAIATVVETWGSSPRPAGSRLAVSASGKLAGSVSGGCIEGAVADAAKQTMASGTPQRSPAPWPKRPRRRCATTRRRT